MKRLSFFLALILAITFLPFFLSTSWLLQHVVTPLAEARIGGHLSIEKASFRWWGIQSIEGITWELGEGHVHIHQLTAKISPLRFNLSQIHLEGVSLQSHETSLSEGEVSWEGEKLVLLHAKGTTYSSEGPGHFQLEGVLPLHAENFTQASLTGDIVNFPIALFDTLGETGGWFSKILGNSLNIVIREKERIVDFQAATPAVNASFQLAIDENLLSLKKPVFIVYSPPKSFLEALESEFSLPLVEVPSHLELTLKQFEWRPGENSIAHFNLEIPTLHFANGLSFKDSVATATLTFKEQKATLYISPEIEGEKGNFSIIAENTYHSPFQISINGKNIPSQVIPGKFNTELIGETFSVEGVIKKDIFSLNFSSDKLKVSPLTLHYETGLELEYPIQIEGKLPSSLVPQAKAPIPFLISLSSFRTTDFTPTTTFCSGSLSIEETILSGFQEEDFAIKDLILHWEGPSLKSTKCSLISRFRTISKNTPLVTWPGPQERLSAHGMLCFSPEWEGVIENLKGEFHYHQTEATLSGTLPLTGAPLLLQGELKTIVPPEWIPSLPLNKPVPLHLTIDHLSIDPIQASWVGVSSKGNLFIEELHLGKHLEAPLATLSSLNTKWNLDGNKNKITIEVMGNASHAKADVHGDLNGYFKADQWIKNNKPNFINAQFETVLNLHNIPSLLFQSLTVHPLELFVGPVVDLNVKLLSKNGQTGGNLDLKGKGQDWSLNGSFNVDRFLTLKDGKKPFTAEWTLTPERYKALAHVFEELNPLILNKAATFSIQIKELQGLISRDLYKMTSQTTCQALLSSTPLSLSIATKPEALRITSLEGIIDSVNGTEWTTTLELSGEMERAEKEPFQSTIRLCLDGHGTPISTTGNLQGVYLAPLLKTLFIKGKWGSLARLLSGRKLDGSWNLSSTQGPFTLQMTGENSSLAIDGQVTNSILALNTPLTADLKITPEISDTLFRGELPFLAAIIQADNRWTLSVDPEGFSCPLRPFTFSSIQAPAIAFDMGRVHFYNDTNVFDVLMMLKAPTQELSIPVWFTPLYFSLNQGKINLKRVDLLVNDQYPLAIWGSIDFPKDRVNLIIGLTSTTLRSAFGLKGVPNSYVLQLPFKGTTSNAKLDSGGAATQISAFLAQFRGGPQGALLSGVINLLSGEKKAPKPTTKPFPWKLPQEELIEEEEKF